MFKLFLGAACIGFAPIFVKLIDMEPSPLGFYRCFMAFIFLSLYIVITTRFKAWRWSKEIYKLVFFAGALFALDLFVWHRSVIYAGAGLGTILGNTQVFYVALIGVVFYREKITALFVFSVLLAFLGIYLLVAYRVSEIENPHYAMGVAYGLFTGIVYASYILVIRKIEGLSDKAPTEQVLAGVSAVCAFFLFIVSYFEGTLRWPVGLEWGWLVALSLVAQVMGWLLITKTLPKTPASRAGLILNAQPVVAVIAGNLILHEKLNFTQVIGAVITLIAIYVGTHRKQFKKI